MDTLEQLCPPRRSTWRKLTLLLVSAQIYSSLSAQGVEIEFTTLPQNHQFYPRDLVSNSAAVRVEGQIVTEGYDLALLKVFRDNSLDVVLAQPLEYQFGKASFSFSPEIHAELAAYDIELHLTANGFVELAHRVEDLVAGDVYLINGQSNAVAAKRGDQSANVDQSPFVRSFGTSSTLAEDTGSDLRWYIAEGDEKFTSGAIGQWGLRLGRLLMDTHHIPIAILNAAHGGKQLSFFQRNDSDPMDRTTNYGRALFRTTAAGVRHAVRALFWYQGERDAVLETTANTYRILFEKALFRLDRGLQRTRKDLYTPNPRRLRCIRFCAIHSGNAAYDSRSFAL